MAATVALPYRGVFINLDRAGERRSALSKQLSALGLDDRYCRFAAIDGQTLQRRSPHLGGVLGVFASHMAVIEQAARETVPTHVLEDDAVVGPAFVPFLGTAALSNALDQYDIVFTEVQLPLNLQALKQLKQQYDTAAADAAPAAIARNVRAFDVAPLNFACASSYFVSPRGAARLAGLLRREWDAGPQLQVDLLFRREAQQRRIRAGCLFPFMTTIGLDSIFDSTADGYGVRPSQLAVAMLRYAFFIGADFDGHAGSLLAELDEWAGEGKADRQRRFMSDVLAVILSRRFQMY